MAGLIVGIGLLIVDAIQHDPTNFFRYIPRFRHSRGIWWNLEWLWRTRPALVIGFAVLSTALVIALAVMITVFVHGLGQRDSLAGENMGEG